VLNDLAGRLVTHENGLKANAEMRSTSDRVLEARKRKTRKEAIYRNEYSRAEKSRRDNNGERRRIDPLDTRVMNLSIPQLFVTLDIDTGIGGSF
jgi:hypothetical protein